MIAAQRFHYMQIYKFLFIFTGGLLFFYLHSEYYDATGSVLYISVLEYK